LYNNIQIVKYAYNVFLINKIIVSLHLITYFKNTRLPEMVRMEELKGRGRL